MHAAGYLNRELKYFWAMAPRLHPDQLIMMFSLDSVHKGSATGTPRLRFGTRKKSWSWPQLGVFLNS